MRSVLQYIEDRQSHPYSKRPIDLCAFFLNY